MSTTSALGGSGPGDLAVIRRAMQSPFFRAAAERAGVNINDPAVAVALAQRAQALLPLHSTTVADEPVESLTAGSDQANSYRRKAIGHYLAVADMKD